MRLRARVREILNPTRNYIGTIEDGKLERVSQLPEPEWLEISEEDGAFFLYYLDADFKCFADGWYLTLEDARRAADRGFGIRDEDWEEVVSP